jgi:ABC-2 type transport system permease protein
VKKYLSVLKVTIREYFVYRLNFILWRFRVVLNILLPLFLWTAVFDRNPVVGTYDKTQFISYLVYGNLIGTFAFGTRTFDISSDINDGKIINTLLKPVSYFGYNLAKELADKLVNFLMAVFEVLILIWVFRLQINSPSNLVLFFPILVNSILISYFINLVLSFIGFWTTEVWPIRFIFITLLFFLSGNYFPLDILPEPIYRLILFTPFPYIFYLPTKLLISSESMKQFSNETISLVTMSYIWLFCSYLIAKLTWTKGIKSFSFWGR